MQFEGCAAEPLTTIMAIFAGVKVESLLLRIVSAGCVDEAEGFCG